MNVNVIFGPEELEDVIYASKGTCLQIAGVDPNADLCGQCQHWLGTGSLIQTHRKAKK